jgi:hypothetical protein
VSENSESLFFMLQKINAKKGEKKFTVIDVRGLRPLLKQVEIPNEMLKAMTDLSLHMDRFYNQKLIKAQEAVQGTQVPPDYFPAFSGSTRTQSKLDKLWKSAFLMRQLMDGVPFESLRLKMNSQDLVDLAPALLQGGPDRLMPNRGLRVHFYQALSNDAFPVVSSNSKNKRRTRLSLSVGEYDKNTQTFSYVSARTGERRYVKFDQRTGKLLTLNPEVKEELIFDLDMAGLDTSNPLVSRHQDISETLAKVHSGEIKSARRETTLSYETTGRLKELLSGAQSTAREATQQQLKEIDDAHGEFLAAVNSAVSSLKGKNLTWPTRKAYAKSEEFFLARSRRVENYLRAALKTNDKEKIENAAAVSVRESFYELKYRFLEADSNIKAILMAMINRKNVMLFGPPGSAKTLLTRTLLEAELKNLSEAQVAQTNSVLAETLLQQPEVAGTIWIKQFHPMSNEGDIVGRIDLKAVRDGKGYVYNRSGSLSSKEVLFALLDEFEKAPAGVKTSLLSLLNERQLMDGDQVVSSNLISVVIATNSTPGEFITGLGDFSTAFPIFDRIQTKAYSLNKLTTQSLEEFHRRIHLGVDTKLKTPLFVYPLTALAKSYRLDSSELKLLTKIHQSFVSEAVKRSEAERKMNQGDPSSFPDFYMNTRGESNRSAISAIIQEFPGAVVLNRVLSGSSPRAFRQGANRFDPTDLLAFAELYTSFNGIYRITYDYDKNGMIFYKVVEKDVGSVVDRIDGREKKTMEDLKFEMDEMAKVLNREINQFVENQKAVIRKTPELYPGLFATEAQRQTWSQKTSGGQ